MRRIVQLEGSNWCGAITACMVLDHFGLPWDLTLAQKRFAEYERRTVADYAGCTADRYLTSYLFEQGLDTFLGCFGYPAIQGDGGYWHVSHTPRQNRIATWYTVHGLLKQGFVAVVSIERDAGKHHFVCVDDAFLRAGEHWFSVWCPIRGHYEEQAERFLLTVDGKSHADEWTFAKLAPTRFASAAEFAAVQDEGAPCK